MTKVDIISGFLGAGKTTLIKKLIAEVFAGQQIVLIENEFGEIGIDGGFLKDAGINITEMNSGCICCSLVGDFATALKKVVDEYHPDRIIIEPSGVGKLSDVERAVLDVADEAGIEIATATTVVDAKKAKMYMKNFGEFFNNQVETARCVVLSRTQDVTADKLDETVKLIREKNHEAAVITTPWDEIEGSVIFGAMSDAKALEHELELEHDHEHHHHHHDDDEECECGHHHHHDDDHDHDHDDHEHEHHHEHEHEHHHDHDHEHHHHHHHDHDADEVFTSWGVETPKKFDRADLEKILDRLANTEEFGQVLRAKGIVQSSDGKWLHFDLTPGESEIREGSADYTGRLCVIGAEIDESKLAGLFGV
ncbi:MAG: cobalamin biosynthesis protein CobW [Lachnospiraceae bacterium]|jgi:G3E family GTPase|nr:cobalamin biosynthesis protein CobW [Lachnospiraceae bacterium]